MAKLPELGGGQPNVVDQAGLEALAMAANGGAIKRADGKEIKSVVFVQCAGQRDDTGTHLSYCSGHCCGTSIKQANYFKDQNPDIDTVIVYQDLRVPGMGEDFYRSAQEKGVIFTKGKASKVTGGESCKVTFKDLILDEENTVAADLVVLATGQVPNAGVDLEAWNPVGDRCRRWRRSRQGATHRDARRSRYSSSTTVRARTCRSSSMASPTRTSSASPTRRAAPASTPPARCAVRWTSCRPRTTPPAPR